MAFFFTGLLPCMDSRHFLDCRNIMYRQPPPCVEGRCAPSGIAPPPCMKMWTSYIFFKICLAHYTSSIVAIQLKSNTEECCYLWAGLMRGIILEHAARYGQDWWQSIILERAATYRQDWWGVSYWSLSYKILTIVSNVYMIWHLSISLNIFISINHQGHFIFKIRG